MNLKDLETIKKEMFSDGVSTIGNIEDHLLFQELQNEVETLLENKPRDISYSLRKTENYFYPLTLHSYNQLHASIFGNTKEFDQSLVKLFNDQLLDVIDEIGGKNSKFMSAVMRHSKKDSRPNPIHQDGDGQFTLTLLMNDVTNDMGTTALIKGSHRFPYSPQDGLAALPEKVIRSFSDPCTGKKGDLVLFFNKAWHLMQSPRLPKTSTVLLFTFDAEFFEHSQKLLPTDTLYGEKFKNILPERLFRKLNDYDYLDSGKRIISTSNNNLLLEINRSKSYSFRAFSYSLVALMTKNILKVLIPIFKPIKRACIRKSKPPTTL